MNKTEGPEAVVREIRRQTRRQYSAEEKIRIVLEGLRGEVSISDLCRREGISRDLYYSWSKSFLEAGKQRLAGDNQAPGHQSRGERTAARKRPAQEVGGRSVVEERCTQKSLVGSGSCQDQ